MDFNLWKPLAGLAMFLLAMALMEETIRRIAGNRFKSLLVQHTSTPLSAIASGTVATAILQSSSFVSLLMLAFVGARLLPLKNAIGVVLGANLGTTATGWLVATIGFKLDLGGLALPLIALGGLLSNMELAHRFRDAARFSLALGLLLLGLQFMKEAVGDASQLIDIETLSQMSGVQFLFLGVVFSAIVQSSSATMVIALSALDAGIIDLPQAAAMAIGADLGTTSTVILGAIGASPNKKRVALGHFLFNLVTDSIGFLLRMPLLVGLSFIDDPTLRLVGFHSAMNVIGIALFLPFVERFTQLLERRFIVPDHRESHFLDDATSAVPDAALQALRNEAAHLFERARQHDLAMIEAVDGSGSLDDPQLAQDYLAIKELEGEIMAFALALDRSSLSLADQEDLDDLLGTTRSSVVSVKTCKEAAEDLAKLHSAGERVLNLVLELQRQIYHWADSREVERVREGADLAHEKIHSRIVRDIRRGILGEMTVSTALNVNRMFYHSNQALASAAAGLISQSCGAKAPG